MVPNHYGIKRQTCFTLRTLTALRLFYGSDYYYTAIAFLRLNIIYILISYDAIECEKCCFCTFFVVPNTSCKLRLVVRKFMTTPRIYSGVWMRKRSNTWNVFDFKMLFSLSLKNDTTIISSNVAHTPHKCRACSNFENK